MIQRFAMEYDNDIDQGSADAALIAGLRQEYEWLADTHRPEDLCQWLVYRVELAKRCPHMAVAV